MKEIANSREITRQKYWPQFSASKGKMSTVYLKHLCSYCLNLCIHIFPHFHVICPFFSPKHVSKPKCNLLTSQFSHSLFLLSLPAVALTAPRVFTAPKEATATSTARHVFIYQICVFSNSPEKNRFA